MGLKYGMPWYLAFSAPFAIMIMFGLLLTGDMIGIVARPGLIVALVGLVGVALLFVTRCAACGKSPYFDDARVDGWPRVLSPIRRFTPERVCSRCGNELAE